MFKYKTAAQISAMTDAERDTYIADKKAHEDNLMKEALDKLEGDLNEKLKSVLSKEESEALKTQFSELKEIVDQLKEGNGGEGKVVSLKQELSEGLKDQRDALKSGEKVRMKEFVIKANVLRSSVSGNPYFMDAGGIGQLATRKLTVYDLFPKVSVPKNMNGTIKYVDWDEATKVRAAAAIAEAGAFPESTAAWATYTLPLQKVGDSVPVSEEFMYDDEMFAAELEAFLRTNVAVKIDTDLITANGTAPNIKGLNASISAYTPVASGITGASIYDLLVKVKSAITKPYGSKYNPDFALMNTDDIDKMMLKKDSNGNYIMPPFVDQMGNTVKGLRIVECNAITANTMIVGDSRYAKIYEEPGFFVGVGYDSDDWSKDLMTMKARKRLNLLVRTVDSTGFLKVTDIAAALVTLAT